MVSITIFDSNTGQMVQVTAVNQSLSLSFDGESAFNLAVEQARSEFQSHARELPSRAPRELPRGQRQGERVPDDEMAGRRRSSSWIGDLLH